MENIWSFLLQTLSVSLIGLLLLVVKLLLDYYDGVLYGDVLVTVDAE